MHIGLVSDGLGHLPLEAALDVAAGLGIEEIELATGNWSTAPHVDLDDLLSSAESRERLLEKIGTRGLRLGALNASGNQLHPLSGAEHDRVVRDTMRLAPQLGIDKIVMMSGLPAVHEGDRVVPWITTCWPRENVAHLARQWEIAEGYWRELAPFAEDQGIAKIAVEMHGDQLVYNAPTLLRLREVAGDIVGANFDPSHLMWMGADILASIRALSGAIHHVHGKDTRIEASVAERTVLETAFFDEAAIRSWNFATIGQGHPGGAAFWGDFCGELRAAGYDGVLSIEHEDVAYSPEEGLEMAVGVLRKSIAA